ncbi:hypothetical protein ACG2K1_00560 [Neisseria sp. 23W00296]|uniref:hypothetical protein n=1 Tax=unclassified Neisseria TaxID=2623750 RepID=UPI0037571084
MLGIDPDTENGYISVDGIDFSVLPAIIAETDKIAKEKNPASFNNCWNRIAYQLANDWTPQEPVFEWAVRYEKNDVFDQTPVIVFFTTEGKRESVSEKNKRLFRRPHGIKAV